MQPSAIPHPPANDWVLVGNAARVRCFERDPGNDALRERADYVHPASRLKGAELGDERGGRARKSEGASTGFAPRTEARHKEHAAFARELAQMLEQAAQAHTYPALSLVISNPFLGELREHLGAATQRRLVACVPLDLGDVQGRELERRLGNALRAAGT